MDICAVWTGSNDTDKKHTEVVVILFNDLIIVASQIPNKNIMKFKEAIKISRVRVVMFPVISQVTYKEPKMRKWTLKKNDVGKFWPKKELKESHPPPSPTPSSHSSQNEEVVIIFLFELTCSFEDQVMRKIDSREDFH